VNNEDFDDKTNGPTLKKSLHLPPTISGTWPHFNHLCSTDP